MKRILDGIGAIFGVEEGKNKYLLIIILIILTILGILGFGFLPWYPKGTPSHLVP